MAEFHPQELRNIMPFIDKSWISPVKQIWCISRGAAFLPARVAWYISSHDGSLYVICQARRRPDLQMQKRRRQLQLRRQTSVYLKQVWQQVSKFRAFLLVTTLCDAFDLCHDCEKMNRTESNLKASWNHVFSCIFHVNHSKPAWINDTRRVWDDVFP